MIENQEDDEFIAVRVQDPRVQNQSSWSSHVDYKIFLHTNSKSFTAKTSCVRRRYSEFVWLKKKLQKNSGLVPVPDLPGKSFFSIINDDFLEKRRTGLQSFLDKVLHMTVCLSDSQLHLFMQTQLPVRHIEDCVQGHTPYTVTDAILTYASSNQGFAQAQEEDLPKERGSSVVSYESMESPAPHLPSQQTSGPRDPLQDIAEAPHADTAQRMVCHSEESSLHVLQEDNRLEAVIERHRPASAGAASFYLGCDHDPPPSPVPEAGWTRVPVVVVVHSPTGGTDATSESLRVETEEVLESGRVAAEGCLVEIEPVAEADSRAPSVPADAMCTEGLEEEVKEEEVKEEEEEEEESMNGNSDSGDRTEAVCSASGLLHSVVPEQAERALEQTQQEFDLECHLSSEEPLERVEGPDGLIGNGRPQEEEEPVEEELCSTNGTAVLETETGGETLASVDDVSPPERHATDQDCALLEQCLTQEEDLEKSNKAEPQGEDGTSSVSSDGIDPTVNTGDDVYVEPEDIGNQNVNGHLEKSAEEVAPSTAVEDTGVSKSHSNSHSTDNWILSEGDEARRETKGAPELRRTSGDLGPDEAPELGASA
ncbi:hypothetical protein NHX12_024499 [Muraenolepis orangiensis]|uniref:PX domain-containing protein n=1 Tax=Muraenolepis orangiensis TaxID=630683 RepID=A0A9Q0EJG8_9TELE|nr:hypothetical protein NHX12_024499 [Muraenolepis orangiensis]